MHTPLFPLRRAVLPVVLLLLAAACQRGDARLDNLAVGISKDSVIAVMGGERPSRIDPYLSGGQYIETMFFIPVRARPEGTDTLPDRKRSPVVAINGAVAGWGWAFWDSVATAHRIVVPPKN